MEQADLKERLRHPKRKSQPIPTLSLRTNLASSYFFFDRFPEAESTLQRASERKLEGRLLLVVRYNLAG